MSTSVKGILTRCPCKQDREQVDADSDGIEKWKNSEAIGDGVHLWKSAGQTCLVLPAQRHYTARANWKLSSLEETMLKLEVGSLKVHKKSVKQPHLLNC